MQEMQFFSIVFGHGRYSLFLSSFTLSPIIMVQWKMELHLKGRTTIGNTPHFFTEPFFTIGGFPVHFQEGTLFMASQPTPP